MDDINTYENYNRIRYQGWEAALYWSDRIGEVHYTIAEALRPRRASTCVTTKTLSTTTSG